MPRKIVACDSYVFDAFVYDRYQSGGEEINERRRKLSIVYEAMKNELTPKEFHALKEYYLNGKKMKDIAQERGVAPSTITRQVRKAREKVMHIAKYY